MLTEGAMPLRLRINPETVGMAAVHWQDLASRQLCAAPSGCHPERSIHSHFASHLLQRAYVLGLVVEFVLDLDTDDVPVRTEQAAQF